MKRWLRPLLAGLGFLLGAVIILPLVVPIPPAPNTCPPQELAGEGSQFVDIDGLIVHFQQAGSGEIPIILLHGFVSNVYTWHRAIEPLGEGQRVVAFDRPGFGLTERPMPPYAGENPYTQYAQVELTIKLLDHFGIDQAVLVGSSAGGTIALLTALEYPERVAGLILVDPAVYFGTGAPTWTRPLLALPQIKRTGPLLVRLIRSWAFNLLGIVWYDPAKITDDIVPGYTAPFQAHNWDRALWEFTLASEDLDLVPRLPELDLPVLVITGEDDIIVPPALTIRLASEINNAELIVIQNCGHVPQEECTEEFLDGVEEFLEQLEKGD